MGTVLSALITAVSLIYQNQKNNNRDSARRKEDSEQRRVDRAHLSNESKMEREHSRQLLLINRKGQLESEESARSFELTHRIRADRLRAHSRMVSGLEKAALAIEESVDTFTATADGLAEQRGDLRAPLTYETRERLIELLVAVDLVAGEDSRRKARNCWNATRSICDQINYANHHQDLNFARTDPVAKNALSMRNLKKGIATLNRDRGIYLDAIRNEIGSAN